MADSPEPSRASSLQPVGDGPGLSGAAAAPGEAPLAGLRVVELSVFIAAPMGGMTLAQLGAEVIRIDPIGGNMDIGRWPLSPDGTSLYWTSLNKGKRSVALALGTPEGQEIASALVCAPGPDAGIALTNLPLRGALSYEALSERRPDLIMAELMGQHDGQTAIDYTVNCASGFPTATGWGVDPVNHVLPAWDVAAGLYLATGILAAERVRSRTGRGQRLTLALSDVMLATVANLGYVADVQVNGASRGRLGNDLYGAYGRDFPTADGRAVMVAAISNGQWRALGEATGLAVKLEALGPLLEVDVGTEGGRFEARHAISAILQPWFAARRLDEIRDAFEGTRVLWGPYQDFRQLVQEDARCSAANPMFAEIDQPGVGRILAPRAPLSLAGTPAIEPRPASRHGADTEDVLRAVLGLGDRELDGLRERRVIGAAAGSRRE